MGLQASWVKGQWSKRIQTLHSCFNTLVLLVLLPPSLTSFCHESRAESRFCDFMSVLRSLCLSSHPSIAILPRSCFLAGSPSLFPTGYCTSFGWNCSLCRGQRVRKVIFSSPAFHSPYVCCSDMTCLCVSAQHRVRQPYPRKSQPPKGDRRFENSDRRPPRCENAGPDGQQKFAVEGFAVQN
jgi:hypothetical protein